MISEMVVISESQKTAEVDDFVNRYFQRANFFVSGKMVTDEVAKKELITECTSELRQQVNQAQSGELKYDDLYILKLSEFLIKTPEGFLPLTFEDTESESQSIFRDTATSFVIYAYHDTLFKIVPYHDVMHTDARLETQASFFLKSPAFDRTFGTDKQRAKFTGEIKVLDFGRRIRVYTEFFNTQANDQQASIEKSPVEKTPFTKAKKSYRPNTPFIHKVFGKGMIKTTTKVRKEPDGDVYNLEIDFPDYGIKKIQAKAAA